MTWKSLGRYRRLALVGLIVFGILLGTVFYLRSFLQSDVVAGYVKKLTGAECAIGAVELAWNGIHFRNVRLAADDLHTPFAVIDNLTVHLKREHWRQFLQKKEIVARQIEIAGAFFDVDRFQKFGDLLQQTIHAATQAAADNPLAASGAANWQLQIEKCSMQNIRVAMRGREIPFQQAYGELRDEKLLFSASGMTDKGNIDATGSAAIFFGADLWQLQQIEIGFKFDKFAVDWITDWFPSTFDFIQAGGNADGTVDIAYHWQDGGTFSFMGALHARQVSTFLFDNSVLIEDGNMEFSGSFNYDADTLVLDSLLIREGAEYFSLSGTIDYSRQKSALQIAGEELPLSLVSAAIDNHFFSDEFSGAINIKGFINTDPDGIEVKVETSSTGLTPLSPLWKTVGKIALKSGIHYKSADHSVSLSEVFIDCRYGGLVGELQIPWLGHFTTANFNCDLTLTAQLPPFGELLGFADLSGVLIGKLSAAGITAVAADSYALKYDLAVNSLEAVQVRPIPERVFNLGKFTARTRGEWRDGLQKIEQLQFSTKFIALAFTGAYHQESLTGNFNARVRPRFFFPLFAVDNAAVEKLGEITGHGKITADKNGILLQENVWRGNWQPPNAEKIDYSLGGEIKITNDQIAFTSGALEAAQSSEMMAAAKFDGVVFPRFDFSATLRAKTDFLFTLLTDYQIADLPKIGGETVLAVQAVPRGLTDEWQWRGNFDHAVIASAFKPQKIAWQAISSRTENSGTVIWRDIKLAGLGFTAAIVPSHSAETIIYQVTTAINTENLFNALREPPAWKIKSNWRGQIKITPPKAGEKFTNFNWQFAAPEMQIINGEVSRKISAPQISLTGNWMRANNAFTISNGALQSADWQFKLAAQSDQLLVNAAEINFGGGAAVNFVATGKRAALAHWLPELSAYLDLAAPDSLEQSVGMRGILRWEKISLADGFASGFLRAARIEDGRIFIDRLGIPPLLITRLNAPYRWQNGILKIADGSGDLAGNFSFNLAFDFFRPRGLLDFRASELGLTQLTRNLSPTTQIVSGYLQIPNPVITDQQFVRAVWQGASLPEILDSLTVDNLSLRITDLSLFAPRQPIDWRRLLETEFHYSVADKLAQILDEALNREVGKPQKWEISETTLTGKVQKQILIIDSLNLIGKNIADLSAIGRIAFDRRLKMRALVRGHLERHLDTALLFSNSLVKNIVDGLPADRRETAQKLLPAWLNELTRSKKIYFDLSGELPQPQVDFTPIQQAVKAALPILLAKAIELVSESRAISELLGKDLSLQREAGKPLVDLDALLK